MIKELKQLEADILGNGGRIDKNQIEAMRDVLYSNGRIGRLAADTLIDLKRRLQRPASPAFGAFFTRAIKDHVLKDGKVAAEEAAWLREMMFHDGVIQDEEKTLLRELHGEATDRSPEFEALFEEVLKQPDERRTQGGGRDEERDRRK